MSTQINITVDLAGLAEKAKQLQKTARQAQLEKDYILSLSADAFDKRIAAQAAKGLTIDGKPLYGATTKQPQIERRPAASPRGQVAILLVPSNPFSEIGINAKTKKLPPPQVFELGTAYMATIAELGGPDNSPAIFSPASLGPTGSEQYGGYLGIFTDPTAFKLLSRQWTFEGYVFLGSLSTGVSLEYDGYSFSVYWYLPNTIPPSPEIPVFEFTVPGADHLQSVDTLQPESSPFVFKYRGDSGIAVGQWVHFAIVQEPSQYKIFLGGTLLKIIGPEQDQENAYYGYIDAVDYFARGRFDIYDNSQQNSPPEAAIKPGVHGYRFTAGKALYTANFTPPASITGFA